MFTGLVKKYIKYYKNKLNNKDEIKDFEEAVKVVNNKRHRRITLAISLFIILYVSFLSKYNLGYITSESMNPTFLEGDIYITRKISKNEEVKVGDVVIIDGDMTNSKFVNKYIKTYIKRIVAEPNEKFEMYDGNIIKNNKVVQEEYADNIKIESLDNINRSEVEKYETLDDEYFLLGDNRFNSYDSRDYGPVNRNQIRRKVIKKIRF